MKGRSHSVAVVAKRWYELQQMKQSGKNIIDEKDLGSCERWQMPIVQGPLDGHSMDPGRLKPMTAAGLQQLQQQAYDESYARGHKEGLAQGLAEGRTRAQAEASQKSALLNGLLEMFAQPLQQLDEEMEANLVELATLIARHLVRRELKTDPGEVIAVVREAMASLPIASRNPTLHINPEDEALIREALGLGEEERSWKLHADPLVTRGGCLIETETSFIDATVEARLSAIIARMLGGERESDSDG